MAKGNRNVNTASETTSTPSETQSTQSSEAPTQSVSAGQNYTLLFKRNHPQNRASYGVPGVPGIVVIQRDLVAGTTPPTSMTDLAGMPQAITMDMLLVDPRADNKTAKAEVAAAKLAERAEKARAKAEAQAAKLVERQAKAKAALEAAQAKAAATLAAANPE